MMPDQFQRAVLTWFQQQGRKDLPWQQNKTPYRVWVSEIMLQQTQVSTVIPYFLRFMERFPTLDSLANAKEDDVLHLWTGLGYYSRARNLHRTAKLILSSFSGQFPHELDSLITLPGIGRSTAGAILSIAFGKKATILDGNVKRVLTRFLCITEWPGEKKVLDQLWEAAERFTPSLQVADYSQAMMDLGATICVRRKPLCEKCPLKTSCLAHEQGIEKTLPRSKPRKVLPVREIILLILRNQHFVLLEKRPPAGIWGGLWSLPEMMSTDEIKKNCKKQFGLEINHIQPIDAFRHTFSHFHLDITPVLVQVKKVAHKIMDDSTQIWYNLHEPAAVGLPAPIKSLLSKLA